MIQLKILTTCLGRHPNKISQAVIVEPGMLNQIKAVMDDPSTFTHVLTQNSSKYSGKKHGPQYAHAQSRVEFEND